jgi:hypothetical protein
MLPSADGRNEWTSHPRRIDNAIEFGRGREAQLNAEERLST